MSATPSFAIDAQAAFDAGDLGRAADLCGRWLTNVPNNDAAIELAAQVAEQLPDRTRGLALIQTVIAQDAEEPAWRLIQGVLLRDLKRPEEALAAATEAARQDPAFPEAHILRATLLEDLRRPDEALSAVEQVAALRPGDAEPVLHAVKLLAHLGRLDRALDRLGVLPPDDHRTHLARASILRSLGRFDDAVAACDRALALNGQDPEARFFKALLLLADGREAEGWPLYEARIGLPGWRHGHLPQTPWDGSPLAGRSLLVHCEQGLGDAIQFYRFVPGLYRQTKVVFSCLPRVAALFAAQPGCPPIITRGRARQNTDLRCSIASLPFLLKVRSDDLPAEPYLTADPAKRQAWEARLPPGPRIGIVWSGNPEHLDDRNRSMTLRTLLTMLPPGLTVLSLQKDPRPDDAQTLRQTGQVVDLGPALDDFTDTAAIVACLDLVISVDTSTAHLAGALGRPVWILLPFAADWRWRRDRPDTPWYRSARLFRQSAPRDWRGVAEEVRDALKEFLNV